MLNQNESSFKEQNKQKIILSTEAFIEESCDTLFSTQNFRKHSATFWFPFVESIFQEFLTSQPLYKSLTFRSVTTSHHFLEGVYDFCFTKIKECNEVIVEWLIYDFTEFYNQQINYQQIFQDQQIKKGY